MSWMPDQDPMLGDKRSCDALDLVVVPRARDLGGFAVRRALPHGRRQMVGPFIFFDQMGPVQFVGGQGMDVRPHPHIGLATVTYLFDGRVMHRDSEGNALEIRPGEMNLMTAGRGIAHSERTPGAARQRAGHVRHPELDRAAGGAGGTDPAFQHFDAAVLPVVEDGGVWARVIAGSAFGLSSPVRRLSEWFYVEVMLDAAASVPLDADHEERAIYVVEGEIEVAGDRFEAPRLLIFRPGDRIAVRATRAARLMLLGGAALEGPRHIWWNFVSSRRERIEQAKEDWKSGAFGRCRGKRVHPTARNVSVAGQRLSIFLRQSCDFCADCFPIPSMRYGVAAMGFRHRAE